jgi:hypothetical protein
VDFELDRVSTVLFFIGGGQNQVSGSFPLRDGELRTSKKRGISQTGSRLEMLKLLRAWITTIFPSWTSRVRSPSPALVFKRLGLPRFRQFPLVSNKNRRHTWRARLRIPSALSCRVRLQLNLLRLLNCAVFSSSASAARSSIA